MNKTKKICYVPWIGTPKNDIIFKNDLGNWEYSLKKLLAEDKIEIHTDDLLKIEDADYCIFFDNLFYKNIDKMWELYYQRLLHKTIYIDYEPPTGHCKNHSTHGIKRLSKIFNKVITYNDDLINHKNIIKGNIANFYSKELPYKHDFNSRKFLTMITNNTGVDQIIGNLNTCNTSNYYNHHNIKNHKHAIYSKREEAARYFMIKCSDEFDLYGMLWTDEFKTVLKGHIDQTKKIEILSEYKFIISYDSFVNQNGYISEKIFDAFQAKTVPVYWGANNVEQYIPKQCFIDKRDFKSYDELYDYLRNISEKDYLSYIKAIEKFLESKKFKDYFSSEASAKKIKDAVLDVRKDFSYENAYKELQWFQKKKDKVDSYRKINFYLSQLLDNGKKVDFIFNIVNYSGDKNVTYELLINDKKVKKYKYKEKILQFDNQIEYEFCCKLNAGIKKANIRVNYICNGKSQPLNLVNYGNNNLSREYGIILSLDKKKIKYYNYLSMNSVQKINYLLFHNRVKFQRLIILYLNKVKYKIKKVLMYIKKEYK
ncbi:MAG: glycosyltransferase family 10 [Bacilli bacterium]